jgi:hypothetical protein
MWSDGSFTAPPLLAAAGYSTDAGAQLRLRSGIRRLLNPQKNPMFDYWSEAKHQVVGASHWGGGAGESGSAWFCARCGWGASLSKTGHFDGGTSYFYIDGSGRPQGRATLKQIGGCREVIVWFLSNEGESGLGRIKGTLARWLIDLTASPA